MWLIIFISFEAKEICIFLLKKIGFKIRDLFVWGGWFVTFKEKNEGNKSMYMYSEVKIVLKKLSSTYVTVDLHNTKWICKSAWFKLIESCLPLKK